MASESSRVVVAVVDDDWRVVESLSAFLSAAGHAVLGFSSAAELLNSTSINTIGCVISDVGMPAIDGFELRRLLSKAFPHLPVILISGRVDKEHPQFAGESDGRFFIKPFDNGALLLSVQQALKEYAGRS